jgi:hypothetical protein
LKAFFSCPNRKKNHQNTPREKPRRSIQVLLAKEIYIFPFRICFAKTPPSGHPAEN